MKSPLSLPVLKRTYLDNSILETVARCPRLGYFNYVINRASRGTNYPIQYGVAYHKFRETIEALYIDWVGKEGQSLDDVQKLIYTTAWAVCTKDWKDPPLEHKKSYLDIGRLERACVQSYKDWILEKQHGHYIVIGNETGFTLPLPSGRVFAGRIDQVLEWNQRLWLRDFKTIGRMDRDLKAKFTPGHQFTGYTWAQSQLSNRAVEGVIIDVVYNIKSKGPEFHPTLATRSSFDIQLWLEWVEHEYDNYQMFWERGMWPMKTSACGDYGGCFFKKCCNSGSNSSMEQWLQDFTIESVWDTLNPEQEKGIPQ